MTYKQWYQLYLKLYKRKLAEKTRESYTRINSLIEPIIGDKVLETITPDDIQQVLITIEDTAGSRQAQIAYALVHAVFCRAVRSQHLQTSPVDAIDRPAHTARTGRVLEEADWNKLRPVINASVAYALMVYAGLRRGEVLALQRADIDLNSEVIHITKQRLRVGGKIITSKPKSTAGIRDVPITSDLQAVLSESTRYMLPSALLIPIAPETLEHHWRCDQIAIGINRLYRLHDLRHTFATRLTLDGLPPRVLQYVLGHASYTLTAKTYTHITATSAKAEFSKLYQ